MFDRIARNYDRVNRIISLGMDRSWRRRAVRYLEPVSGGRYLDIGTGTGDLALEILRQAPDAEVIGIDPAERMLQIASRKTADLPVSFICGDALHLPQEDDAFDGIVSGFCFRNMEDRRRALNEMFRVLKPGGKLVILEAVYPENRLVLAGYRFIVPLIPFIGKIFTNGSDYKYLIDSIKNFPAQASVAKMLEEAGFVDVHCTTLNLGTICIFSGRKYKRAGGKRKERSNG